MKFEIFFSRLINLATNDYVSRSVDHNVLENTDFGILERDEAEILSRIQFNCSTVHKLTA